MVDAERKEHPLFSKSERNALAKLFLRAAAADEVEYGQGVRVMEWRVGWTKAPDYLLMLTLAPSDLAGLRFHRQVLAVARALAADMPGTTRRLETLEEGPIE